MRARIHRGAAEVGGSCVELEAAEGDRLVLDLGMPLEPEAAVKPALPAIRGLADGEGPLRGVVLSHSHPDHYGLLEQISPNVPLVMGEATSRILGEASFFTTLGLERRPTSHLVDQVPLRLGAFRVTPYLVDHSAFDAYALLVEADNRRLFYSGDLRAHGRKAALFERLLAAPPCDVHALLLEGTTVGRPGGSEFLREDDVERRCAEIFSATPGMALACLSPQNVDRLVSVYRAALSSGRGLVMDLYAAAIAAATGRASIPQLDWDRVHVYVPNAQRVRVKESGQFWRVNDLGDSRIYGEQLAAEPDRWVICARQSMLRELERASCLRGAGAVWLMWPGYLRRADGQAFLGSLRALGIELEVVHSSGHASVGDLQRLAAAIAADNLVPIHTDAPQRYLDLFEGVRAQPDGAWWEV